MKHERIFLAALLALSGLLAAGGVSAQPHMESMSDYAEVPDAEPDILLRRLVGSYKLDGAIVSGDCTDPKNCSGITGKAECAGIGDGPGVQCIYNATWPDSLYHRPFLDPAMSLFGLDPGKSTVEFLLVINKSLAHEGRGVIKGNMVAFKMFCRGIDYTGECRVGWRIEARPDASIVYLWILDHIVIAMRRVPPAQSE